MNVEDSYEIAVRRLSRLGHAGVEPAPPRDETRERLRDLEELATIACDDNDRLTRELDVAHGEIARLKRLVATLQESMISAQAEDALAAPKRRRRGPLFYLFLIALVGGGGVMYVQRPWERLQHVSATAFAAAPVTTPVVSAPVVTGPVVTTPVVTAPVATAPAVTAPVAAPAPKPSAPAVAAPATTSIPKAAPTIPKAPAAVAKSKHRHEAKRHAAKKARHEGRKRGVAAHGGKPAVSDTDDPLGGLNL